MYYSWSKVGATEYRGEVFQGRTPLEAAAGCWRLLEAAGPRAHWRLPEARLEITNCYRSVPKVFELL